VPASTSFQTDGGKGAPSRSVIYLGLVVALVLPYLTYLLVGGIFGKEQSVARVVIGMVVHWINLLAVLFVVLQLERQPLSSIGLRPWRWGTLFFGVLAGFVVLLSYPLIAMLNSRLGLTTDESLFRFLASLSFWIRLGVVLTAGFFEETLYRGYAFERITYLTGSKWLAGVVTLAAFTLMHIPAVGFVHLLPVFIVGLFVTLLYIWRRNLALNIVAHIVIDGIALLVLPALK